MTNTDDIPAAIRRHEAELQRLFPLWAAERQRAFEEWAYSEDWPHDREAWRSPLFMQLSNELSETLNALDDLSDGIYSPPEPVAEAFRVNGIQPRPEL